MFACVFMCVCVCVCVVCVCIYELCNPFRFVLIFFVHLIFPSHKVCSCVCVLFFKFLLEQSCFTMYYFLLYVKTTIPEDTCTPMCIVALFTAVRTWKQPPSAEECVKMWHIHNGILLSHKRIKIVPFAEMWMDLETVIQVNIILFCLLQVKLGGRILQKIVREEPGLELKHLCSMAILAYSAPHCYIKYQSPAIQKELA